MGDCDNWSYEMKEEYKEALPKLANISGISMAGAFDVWGIYKTNTLTLNKGFIYKCPSSTAFASQTQKPFGIRTETQQF